MKIGTGVSFEVIVQAHVGGRHQIAAAAHATVCSPARLSCARLAGVIPNV
jgi:hypothetical protein